MTIEAPAFTLVLLLLIVKFCQLAVYPYLRPALPKISYGLAYPVSILFLTLVSWYLGITHLPVQLSLLPFAILFGIAVWKKQILWSEIKANAIFDIIFLAGFVLILAVRFAYPGIIVSGEKFMDAAILGSIMNNPVVAPADAWFGGTPLTVYYYLGHWMMGVLGILACGTSTVVFNLMLPLVFGLAAVAAFSIGELLFDRRRAWIPLLVLIIPNIVLFIQLILGNGVTMALWNSTRVIGAGTTINEYPLFSFLWGDPHAHVLGCFNQLTFICLLLVLLTQWKELKTYGKYLLAVLLAVSLGTMPVMNSWDVLVYAPLYIIAAIIVWVICRKENDHTGPCLLGIPAHELLPLILVPILSLLAYALFLTTMVSAGGSSIAGIGFVTTPSDLLEFLGVWGIFLLIVVLDGLKTLKRFPWLVIIPIVLFFFGYGALGVALFCFLLLILRKEKFADTFLAAAGCLLLILMELFYIKDYMGADYYRMNTVFKIGFATWFILGTSCFIMIPRWIRGRFAGVSRKRFLTVVSVIYAILVLLLAGGGAAINVYNSGTLDGSDWLFSEHPGDALGISWLKENANSSDIVAEAAGTSYTYSSRISAMTGLSTPLGWAGHETGWRTGMASIDAVVADLRQMYENPGFTIYLMEKYGVDYLYVGEVEKSQYSVSLPQTGLECVFSADDTEIYRISP
ncbi:MAG TPA: DUF2298 domain-containing protein [Methanocorpusculum sp.]|nr:DUF2298 domain-containing protein [Methanocorpusculum sp.]